MVRFLAFVVTIYSLALPTHSLDLASLMTIKAGTANGGCDAYTTHLDQYSTESLQSLIVAIDSINTHGAANTASGKQVRRALNTYFKIPFKATSGRQGREKVVSNLDYVRRWLLGQHGNMIPAENLLFCDSTFLIPQALTEQALDFQGNGIFSDKEKKTEMKPGENGWWSGAHSPANTYIFAKPGEGGDFCSSDPGNMGLTAKLDYISAGTKFTGDWLAAMVLCPGSFTSTKPDTWPAGSAMIRPGMTLEDVVPKCMTLLHEAFHILHGAEFLAGKAEFYELATCLETKKTTTNLKRNPESYVYFIATMYYLFGTAPAIPTNWDFTNKPGTARRP